MNTDWFTSNYSNAELCNIITKYSRDVQVDFEKVDSKTGRCTLVRHLESLDQYVNNMNQEQRTALGV